MSLAEQLGNIGQQATLHQNIGEIQAKQGEDENAVTSFSRSLELARQAKLAEYEALSLSGLAQLHLRQREPDLAAPLLAQAEQAALKIELKYLLPEIYRGQAQHYLALAQADGSLETALDYIERSLQAARELEAGQEEGISLCTLAEIKLAAGESEPALVAFSQSLSLLAKLDPFEAARTKAAWGRYLTTGSHPERGQQLLAEAQTTFQDLGAQRDLAEIEKDI